MTKPTNTEREGRILDDDADLIVHYGYDKTTVSDIARASGVSKGTVYLHFESKDELFDRLLLRELQRYAEQWMERVEADPRGGTIGGMYRSMLHALQENPFMAAMLKQDRHVFGSYLRKPDTLLRKLREGRQQSSRVQFVVMMQGAGAIRADLDPDVTAHVMNIVAYGLVGIGEVVDPDTVPPIRDVIEAIGDLMDQALTPADGGNREAGKAIVRQIYDGGRARLDESERGRPDLASARLTAHRVLPFWLALPAWGAHSVMFYEMLSTSPGAADAERLHSGSTGWQPRRHVWHGRQSHH